MPWVIEFNKGFATRKEALKVANKIPLGIVTKRKKKGKGKKWKL